MDDDKFLKLVEKTDTFLAEIGTEFSLDPLSLSAVMMARLTWVNKEVGSIEQYSKLISSIQEKIESGVLDLEKDVKIH
jgi:hypothetical protein